MPDSLPPISTAVREIAAGTAPAATTLAEALSIALYSRVTVLTVIYNAGSHGAR